MNRKSDFGNTSAGSQLTYRTIDLDPNFAMAYRIVEKLGGGGGDGAA
jgi:hypothetical protein